jgi:hypothetical protein
MKIFAGVLGFVLTSFAVAYWRIRVRRAKKRIGDVFLSGTETTLAPAARRRTDPRRDQKWNSYSDYLNSDTWKQKVQKIMERCHGMCEECRFNETEKPARVVHHCRYTPLWGDEDENDLIALCFQCHHKRHAVTQYKIPIIHEKWGRPHVVAALTGLDGEGYCVSYGDTIQGFETEAAAMDFIKQLQIIEIEKLDEAPTSEPSKPPIQRDGIRAATYPDKLPPNEAEISKDQNTGLIRLAVETLFYMALPIAIIIALYWFLKWIEGASNFR